MAPAFFLASPLFNLLPDRIARAETMRKASLLGEEGVPRSEAIAARVVLGVFFIARVMTNGVFWLRMLGMDFRADTRA